ncbi:MAG: hypothetical protein Q9227_009467 [Pyrenula ochraceoflavens]
MSEIQIDLVDGIRGESIPEKALPYPMQKDTLSPGNLGSWRAHLNAIKEVVAKNLTSALIIEDDVDWDVRIKKQLYDYSLAVQALTQPLAGHSNTYFDPTYPDPSLNDTQTPEHATLDNLPSTSPPITSPYGDEWDILWLGHCGTIRPTPYLSTQSALVPQGAVLQLSDPTVPSSSYFSAWSADRWGASSDDYPYAYPPHTRITQHSLQTTCSLAYAVTQHAARALLYEVGVKGEFAQNYDMMLREACQGNGQKMVKMNCLTVQPQLFNHHRPRGYERFESDISNHGPEVHEKASTNILRMSARVNLEGWLAGREADVDQWPDEDLA